MLAGPVLAGEVKVEAVNIPAYKGWPGHWVCDKVKVCDIDVIMCIPYWIHIEDQDPIKLTQVTIHEWSGCKTTAVDCNFDATLSCYVTAVTGVVGEWSCSIDPANIPACGCETTICVTVKKLDLKSLPGEPTENDVKVATLTIEVIPTVCP